ncbi:MAG: GNAT family N-acetyltransferase [Spirosoma sp.]|nr:GNAT family N-acetyltransferase [Spirosoma sp.]
MLGVRLANRQEDADGVAQLHRRVARISQGIAHTEAELTDAYFAGLFDTVERRGLMLVAVDEAEQVMAEIHASKSSIHIFEHNLVDLTIVVDPDWQEKGIGKGLLWAFLSEVQRRFPEVRRVELESRSSNQASIGLYKSVGFVEEGRMRGKTRNADGSFEDSLLMAWYKPQTD